MKAISLLFALLFCLNFSTLIAQDSTGGAAAGAAASPRSGSSSGGAGGVGLALSANYVLKPSDVVRIEVYQEADLGKEVRVEGDGSVTLALIGKVKVAGMTLAEAQSLITDLYNRDYLVDPQISLLVVSFAPKYVYVLGMVGRPGKVAMPPDQDLTLIDAISECGGVTRLGNPRKVRIKRADGSSPFDVNYDDIRRGDSRDIILEEGDTISVPERII